MPIDEKKRGKSMNYNDTVIGLIFMHGLEDCILFTTFRKNI